MIGIDEFFRETGFDRGQWVFYTMRVCRKPIGQGETIAWLHARTPVKLIFDSLIDTDDIWSHPIIAHVPTDIWGSWHINLDLLSPPILRELAFWVAEVRLVR